MGIQDDVIKTLNLMKFIEKLGKNILLYRDQRGQGQRLMTNTYVYSGSELRQK